MEVVGIFGFIVLIITTLISIQGIRRRSYLDKYSFQVDEILIQKDYKRLITSGFLHVGWWHLAFNMLTLYWFSGSLEDEMGVGRIATVYFGSLLAGNLLALYFHRNHGDYSAVGASGAVSGLIFASIALFPGLKLSLIVLPIFVPAWFYGICFVLFTIYGIKSQRDNIGHEAHLGGGLAGMLIGLAFFPDKFFVNYIPILLVVIPSFAFLILVFRKPEILMVDNPFGKPKGDYTIEDKYNDSKRQREADLDELLDKINRNGMSSLTKKERERLEELSSLK
jgi:membrane associated rhomboid family serine protease